MKCLQGHQASLIRAMHVDKRLFGVRQSFYHHPVGFALSLSALFTPRVDMPEV